MHDSIVFTHTEVMPSRREHWLGRELVKAALDQVRDDSALRVTAPQSAGRRRHHGTR